MNATQFGSTCINPNVCKPNARIDELMQHTMRCFAPHAAAREEAINTLATQENIDPFSAMLKYDMHMAPMTTNREMLSYCGMDFPAADNADDQWFTDTWLPYLINGLASLGVFLVNTNHLTDAQLYERLLIVLDEPVHFLPPFAGANEYLDLAHDARSTTPVSDRDDTLPRPSSCPYATE